MTTVITPVGTSLFTNGAEQNSDISNYFADIKNLRASDWDLYNNHIEYLSCATTNFIEANRESASAEIQSIYTIQDKLKEDMLSIRLFASDTIASRLAAETLSEWLSNHPGILENRVTFEFNNSTDVIKGLQVWDPNEFQNSGVPNLKQWLKDNATPQDNQRFAINITGGYAVVVPYLTIFAQSNNISLYYNFEDATTLISLL